MITESDTNDVELEKALIVKDLEELQNKNLTSFIFSILGCFIMPRVTIGLQLLNTIKIYSMNSESKILRCRNYLYHYDYITFQGMAFFASISRLGRKLKKT